MSVTLSVAGGIAIGGAYACVAKAAIGDKAHETARAIADNGPLAVRALKQSLAIDRAALSSALEREASAQAESYASAELGEGLAAVKAKRKAVFGEP